MTDTATSTLALRRFYRRAITVTALALFAVTAVATLAAPTSAGASMPVATLAGATAPHAPGKRFRSR